MAVSPLAWMFVAYSVIWTAIVLYVVNLGRRQGAMEREVAALRAALEADPVGGEPGSTAAVAGTPATRVP